MIEPSKKDKKILRQAIDIGLEKDFLAAITDLGIIIDGWRENKEDNRKTYHALYSSLTDHDKLIARRYDGLTGGRYLGRVIELFENNLIDENDLVGLSDELLQYIKR